VDEDKAGHASRTWRRTARRCLGDEGDDFIEGEDAEAEGDPKEMDR
jgi:hypothetical protein